MRMQNKDFEREFFDNATVVSPWTTFNKNGQRHIFNLFEDLIKPQKGEIVVDMGCGTGEFSSRLKEYSLNVTGLDISKKTIEFCNEKYKKIEIYFEVGDIEETKLKDNSVDIIFFGGVLHHFLNREKVFKEAYRILKNRGRIFAFDPNYYNLIIWSYRILLGVKTLKTENEILLKADDIANELRNAGFLHIDVKATANMSFERDYFKKLVPFPLYYTVYVYNLIERIFQKIKPLQEKYGSFIITIARK